MLHSADCAVAMHNAWLPAAAEDDEQDEDVGGVAGLAGAWGAESSSQQYSDEDVQVG